MLTVCCLKWGDKYGREYVLRLQRGVERNLTVPHRFVCFTEAPIEGVDWEPLPSELPSWWSKIGLTKPGLFSGPVLYLDLDVIIRDSLDPLVALLEQGPGPWCRDDFSYSLRKPRQDLDVGSRLYLGGVGTVNSSVMLWHGDAMRKVWDEWRPEFMKQCHGDQNIISRTLGIDGIRFIPDQLVTSYKYARHRGEPDGNVVVFHGDPKPPDLPASHPLRQLWAA